MDSLVLIQMRNWSVASKVAYLRHQVGEMLEKGVKWEAAGDTLRSEAALRVALYNERLLAEIETSR